MGFAIPRTPGWGPLQKGKASGWGRHPERENYWADSQLSPGEGISSGKKTSEARSGIILIGFPGGWTSIVSHRLGSADGKNLQSAFGGSSAMASAGT